jgi:regulator of protease activity HflC (stomatin/prohibitin superfamily)
MARDHDNHAGHKQVTGLLLPGILALLLALLAGGAWFLGSAVALAAGLHWLLLLMLLLGTRRSLSLAVLVPQEGPAPRVRSLPMLRLLGGSLVLAAAAALYVLGALEPVTHLSGTIGLAVLLVGLAFGGGVLARYYQATPEADLPDGHGLATAARVGAWLALLAAISTVLRAAGKPLWEPATVIVLLALPSMVALELLVSGFGGLFYRPRAGAPFGADLMVTRLLGSDFNLLQSVFTAVERSSGVDVRSSWALGFLRRAALPVLATLALLTWLLSAVVVVDASQLASRERFGRVDPNKVLQPGLHVGLPWPFDCVHVVDVQRVRELPIGYLEAKAGADALWTQYHAAEEYNLLLGDGRDLVTINADLQYRVGDLHAWLYGSQNPDEALETLAYRVLMELTVDQTLEQVLSLDIGDFSARMVGQIQAEADRLELGIEVVAFNLRGLHPPVAVANDYQAVVSAQIDRGTYIMEAQAYRYGALPKAEANAARTTRKAEAEQATRLSKAGGEAIAFRTLEAQVAANPELYRFRRRLETLEQVLKDNPHYVIDARIERDGGALWVLE